MQIEQVAISTLISPEWNPRQANDKEFKDLKDSITKFGFVDPVIVNKRNNHIVGGNFRVRIAKDMGMTEVPCVYVDLDDEQEKELNIRLNRNTGEWDWDALAGFDKELLMSWGFDEKELDFKFGVDSENLGYTIDCPHCNEKIKVSNRVKTVEKL